MKRFILLAAMCFFIVCSAGTTVFAQDGTDLNSAGENTVENTVVTEENAAVTEDKNVNDVQKQEPQAVEEQVAEQKAKEITGGQNTEEQIAADKEQTEKSQEEESSKVTAEEGTDNPSDVQPDGWNEDHSAYYENGQAVKDRLIKDGETTYYADSEGNAKVADGVVKTGGKTYYFDDGKGIAKGWKKCSDGFLRYGLGDGMVATRVTKIGKKLYYFTSNGKAYKKGFVTYNGATYYSKGKGLLATGYNAIGKYGYYFYKSTGKMAKNTKIGHLKIGKSGKLHGAYAKAIKVLNKKGWKLKAAYKWAYKLKYAHRWMRKKTSEKYAYYGFTKKKGNCFVMAATFYTMGKLLGYDIHQVKGYVNGKHPHSWTVIKLGKKEWVFDPNFRNETGRNGWKIYYGKKGTWRYNRYKKMN